jgi:UDP:flavonoid glycosyltransferase YjiC (YdhE family)
MPLVLRLREMGHDVVCAVPRLLSFYLGPLRLPVLPLGRGVELEVLKDLGSLTTRFDGWSSLRYLVDRHVTASLAADVEAIGKLFASDGRPDLVVTAPFAAAARIAAHRYGVPRVDISIYPTVMARTRYATGFAGRFRARCAELAGLGSGQAADDLVTELAWGVGSDTILLHDTEVLRVSELAVPAEPVGFPYWDDAVRQNGDEEASMLRWLDQAETSVVVVTMGSYLGARRPEYWEQVVQMVADLGIRAVLLGPRRLEDIVGATNSSCFAAAFVPLSNLAGRVAAVVHHGGIGTTFAALQAGTPAVVVPRFFDQPFNARLVEATGSGLAATPEMLPAALERVLSEHSSFRQRAGEVSGRLVPPDTATERAVELVLARL